MMRECQNKVALSIFFLITIFTNCTNNISENADEVLLEAQILVISGNNQTGKGGSLLKDPVVIEVIDSNLQPLSDIRVFCRVVEGSGRVIDGASLFTDSRGRAEVRWLIGSGYNGVELLIDDDEFRGKPAYVYATGENPSGLFRTRTIASLGRLDDKLYTITFYGDYTDILDEVNNRIINSTPNSSMDYAGVGQQCSFYSAFGNARPYFFWRSYDNPSDWDCLTLVSRCNPPDGHASLTLSRMKDYGFEVGTDFDSLLFHEKTGLFEAVYRTPDGINEHGVSVACAGVRALNFEPEPDRKSIWITGFVREVLDHAQNIDEGIKIAEQHNIFDRHLHTLATHFLIADQSGRSVILELYDGKIQVIHNYQPWQVGTNSPVFNVPIDEKKQTCFRFKLIYNQLEAHNGQILWEQGMDILETVKLPGTQWSAVYDLTNKKMHIALNCYFEKFYHFAFQKIN